MSVSPGATINAFQFNSLQNRVSQILGTGSGDFGYGQTVTSLQVKPPSDPQQEDADTITAEQWNNLREDMRRAFVHQNGGTFSVAAFVGSQDDAENSDIVGAQSTTKSIFFSDDDSKDPIQDSDTQDFSKGYANLDNIISNLELRRLEISPSEASTDPVYNDTRVSAFNNAIISEFRLNFKTADSRRHFFNAGGQLRFSGSVDNTENESSESYQRNETWNDLIVNPGEIVFGYDYTDLPSNATNGITVASDVGNYGLTSTYAVIFKKEAAGGLYGDSYWQIQARAVSDRSIDIKISVVDQGPESNTDAGAPGGSEPGEREPVTANIDFFLEGRRSDGEVVTEYPTVQILSSFES